MFKKKLACKNFYLGIQNKNLEEILTNPDYYKNKENDSNYINNKKTVDYIRNEIHSNNINNTLNVKNKLFDVKKNNTYCFSKLEKMLNKNFIDSMLEILLNNCDSSFYKYYVNYFVRFNFYDNILMEKEVKLDESSCFNSLNLNSDTFDMTN